ncbi:MAG TPA: site-2 protease family protein [Actinomycetota bacterium]|nr:site-2 protease family protein [Actinomycetota bacterium]
MLPRRGFRLGKILGVEVTLDASWFIFGAVITWLLATTFHTGAPHVSTGAGYLLGAMGALLFLCSVLAHELSHAVVAQRKGIPVHSITLFIFGGVAQITEEPHTPGDEFRIAIAGPALSVVLGVVFWTLGAGARAIGAPAGDALFHMMGYTNLALAAFNLLPGFPLDGGRVFRAAMWHSTGDFAKATRIASTSGRIIGFGLIGLGGLMAFGRDWIDGIWLACIGLFLVQAATGSRRQAVLQATRPATVGDLMTRQPDWVRADQPIDDAFGARLAAARDRALPVVGAASGAPEPGSGAPEPGWIVGVVTAEVLATIPREHWAALTAGQVMIPMQWAMVAQAGEPLESVFARLGMNPAGRFVVLEAGRLVGMLTPAALARPAPYPASPAPQRG